MVKNSVRSIITAIDAAAGRWSDHRFAARKEARDAVSGRTGYSLSAVDYAFDQLFGTLRREAIGAIIADELGSIDVLDRFAERPARPRARALPIGRVCVISSRTTIGVAVVPALFALCAKCPVLVKDREDHFIAAFFATLIEELPDLADAVSAQFWTGDDEDFDLGPFGAVVAFGTDATLARIAANLRFPTRFIAFGTKASAGYVTREALHNEKAVKTIAAGAARDLLLYESEGCLSLHALFVESGGNISPNHFADLLVDAMHTVAAELLPPGSHPQTTALRAMARDVATFRSRESVYSEPGADYLAVLDPPFDEPPFFLPRAIGIRRVDHPSQAVEYILRHGITLEGLAVAGFREELLELATSAGVARIAPFGALQAPPIGAFHGGRPRIAEFVHWIGNET